ncbi:hypothetical protein PFICI_08677 [Pestalotiopsis fici W106-1]|uniref:Uncharacterized protein n=1 Tax=Pestalotiopsis fici (strain W106-1 / CGMCC3.15140) TaxID=1229662 RepID=W3WYH2_PESFW|nr:uncharacterized protein PFICI_08677 [Pestalotiopsis fici W106-1]ETS78824.1 hypothetical protein PFICI_08677 [Pestalotiopsis fici W106-1]
MLTSRFIYVIALALGVIAAPLDATSPEAVVVRGEGNTDACAETEKRDQDTFYITGC